MSSRRASAKPAERETSDRLRDVLRIGRARLMAPCHFTFNEDESSMLENHLSDANRKALRATPRSSSRHTGTVVLTDWRRDEDKRPLGPDHFYKYKWEFKLEEDKDSDCETGVQYVSTSICGKEEGVSMRIEFYGKENGTEVGDLSKATEGTDVYFRDEGVKQFPLAFQNVIALYIPEWNLFGTYDLDYGKQKCYISPIYVNKDDRRFSCLDLIIPLVIREHDKYNVYVSFAFDCFFDAVAGGGDNMATWFLTYIKVDRA
jgi:hypothetical protein